MPSHRNVALKSALFATGQQQQQIAKVARIPEWKLTHVIAGRRDLDKPERDRLIKALARYGVKSSIDQLFPPEAIAS